jgi:hypothetical protein
VVIAVDFVVAVASEFAFQLFAVILSAAKDLLQTSLPLHRAAAVAVASASVYVVIPSAARDLLQTQWNLPSLLLSPSYLHSHLHFRVPHPSSLRKGGRRCCCLFLVSVSAVVPPALTEEGTAARALFASQRGISPPLLAIALRSPLRCSPLRHQARHDQNESRPRREARRNFPSPKGGVNPARQRRTLKPRESRRSSDAVRARL